MNFQNLTPSAESTPANTSMPGALLGGVVAAVLGALLWGIVGKITGGWEFKYGAVVIGIMAGAGVALMGRGQSPVFGIVAAVFGLGGILAGKVLFELLVHSGWTMGEHIAYHLTFIDFIFYAATAAAGFGVAGTPAGAPVLNKIRDAVPMLRPS